MQIYTISDNYINYLRTFDFKVPYNKNSTRPYVGVVFNMNGSDFFAPLSSPKPKHLTMKEGLDIIKIDKGSLGVINFNNMIPIPKQELTLIDFSKQPPAYAQLLTKQQVFLGENKTSIRNKGQKLYNLYTSGRLSDNVKFRCCDFPLLEKKCELWKKQNYTAPTSIVNQPEQTR